MKDKLNYNRKSYTITDYYLSYKDYIEEGTQYDVDYTTFRNIVSDYFKYIRDEVMLNSKEVKLPCRLGTLQIVKHQPKEYTGKSLRWDWKSTRELGKPVYYLNDHTGGFKYRFHWSKQGCILKNKSKYMFVACRTNKRSLCVIIKNKQCDYIEM